MRIHRKGYIECARIVVSVPDEIIRRGQHLHPYLTQGVETEIGEYLGVKITGSERIRQARDMSRLSVEVTIEDDWAPPTRR